MANWGADTGILRKNKPKDDLSDLLMFGYACKLFRDDEKAAHIDKGKHLIPWMGNENIKIDRYDCRGALSDITQYEASREGFDAMRWLGLSEAEMRIEEMCDKERYYSLNINEAEEAMYKEEEQKRQQINEFHYSYDVPSNPDAPKEMTPTLPEAEEVDEEYKPLPSLDVPVDIAIPKTVKENARIEKTALFVCKQGPQMEILLKAKQSGNPQFGFLNQGDPLYKYYRHVLHALKAGRYQVMSGMQTEMKYGIAEGAFGDDHYLHPSLVSSNLSQPDVQTSSIPSVPYKPSANCTYTQLVSKIQSGSSNAGGFVHGPSDVGQQHQQQEVLPEHVQKPAPSGAEMAQYEQQQQYYQNYYAHQYYEYYKQLAQYQQGNGHTDQQAVQPPETQLDPSVQAYIQQMAYAQYLQQQQQHHQQQQQQMASASTNNPYAQIVSNLNKDVTNPYAPFLASIQQNLTQMQQQHQQPILEQPAPNISKEPVLYSLVHSTVSANAAVSADTSMEKEASTVKVVEPKKSIHKPLLSLAQYGSDTDDSDDEDSSNDDDEAPANQEPLKVPDGETKVVIDKMASYVAKNGGQFEEIVKAKGDPRFEFLKEGHEFYKYYRRRIGEYKHEEGENVQEESIKKEAGTEVAPPKVKEKKVIAPVSFSIKKPKDDGPKDIKSALPIEESDEESPPTDDATKKTEIATTVAGSASVPVLPTPIPTTSTVTNVNVTTALVPAIVPASTQSVSTSGVISSATFTTINSSNGSSSGTISTVASVPSPVVSTAVTSVDVVPPAPDPPKIEAPTPPPVVEPSKQPIPAKQNGFIVDEDDPLLEMIDLTNDLEERKDARRAEDKIKDKLASAAREKMASVARDKALQLERKKKAAAFLTKLKNAAENAPKVANTAATAVTAIVQEESSPKKRKIKQKSNNSELQMNTEMKNLLVLEVTREVMKSKENSRDKPIRIRDSSEDEAEAESSRRRRRKKKSHKCEEETSCERKVSRVVKVPKEEDRESRGSSKEERSLRIPDSSDNETEQDDSRKKRKKRKPHKRSYVIEEEASSEKRKYIPVEVSKYVEREPRGCSREKGIRIPDCSDNEVELDASRRKRKKRSHKREEEASSERKIYRSLEVFKEEDRESRESSIRIQDSSENEIEQDDSRKKKKKKKSHKCEEEASSERKSSRLLEVPKEEDRESRGTSRERSVIIPDSSDNEEEQDDSRRKRKKKKSHKRKHSKCKHDSKSKKKSKKKHRRSDSLSSTSSKSS